MGRTTRALALGLGLFALAFALRIANLGLVFVGGSVRFPSGRDELYHVRKIVYQALRFPEMLDFDPYVSFPFGAKPVWPPFLDWVVAALARLVAAPDALSVERAIVWLPPLLGAVTVAALGELGRRRFGLLAGAVAGLLLATLPAHHTHSQLGQVDHQVVLGLGTVLMFAAAYAWLAAPPGSRRSHAWAAALGLVLAGSLVVSPGALLQILPFQTFALVFVLSGRDRADAIGRARSGALAHGVAAALVLPACLASGPFAGLGAYSPLVLSRFQPLWLGAGALALALLAEAWQRSRAGEYRAQRAALAAALAGGAGLLALACVPGLASALGRAGGWFTGGEQFLSTVMEAQPLFFPAGAFDAGFALRELTAGLFVFPVAWLVLAFRGGLDPNARPRHALLLVWSGAFFGLALAQERFANAFAPGLALVLAVAGVELWQVAKRRPRLRLASGAALAVLGVAALAPPARNYCELIAYSAFVWQRGQPVVPVSMRRMQVVEEAARFLRVASPPTRGFLDASLRPEYGVLSAWGDGHLVRYRAERPTVQDNFGSFADARAFALAGRYFEAEHEEAAYRTAEELGARYVVATRGGSGQSETPSARSLGQRLWRRLGNAVPATASGAGAPALARHRLLWAGDLSGRPRDVEAPAPDRVAVFEIVPGARVSGVAPPDTTVHFELELAIGHGRTWYRARAESSREGRYELRLPYPTDVPVSGEVRALSDYRVRCGTQSAALELHEADVRAGATVHGPDLEDGA